MTASIKTLVTSHCDCSLGTVVIDVHQRQTSEERILNKPGTLSAVIMIQDEKQALCARLTLDELERVILHATRARDKIKRVQEGKDE